MLQACLQQTDIDVAECAKPSEELKSRVEREANTVNLFTILVQLVPSALLSIFVGTWSDKYGSLRYSYLFISNNFQTQTS